MEDAFLITLWLTLRLAATTTLLLFGCSVPLAWYLSRSKGWFARLLEMGVTLPLVLPPTVIGFYLLLLLGPEGFLGSIFLRWFDLRLVFSFPGLLLGSMVYSLPFMVQPIKTGLDKLPEHLSEAARLMGRTEWQLLVQVLLPNSLPAIRTAGILTFTHTLGEFGIVLMIGGNIPGETRMASMAIYDAVEALRYDQANAYALTLIGITIFLLALGPWRMGPRAES